MSAPAPIAAAALQGASGLIHATPTGMDKLPGLPLPAELLRPELWVAEIVYFPLDTELLRAARAKGCATVDGGTMAVGQAIGAFELFTGRPADAARVEAHFRGLLARAPRGLNFSERQAMPTTVDREAIGELPNPLGLAGIEFVEYATSRPQALGQVLETLGFRPVARHRSREVLLYRQGPMNIVINAHDAQRPGSIVPAETPVIAAVALRVRDAAAAYQRALDRGAWAVPVQVEVMELHIPAIHGVGASRIYFVDRWDAFSIWDVDFVPIPTVDKQPPAIAGLHWFGLVQYIGTDRMDDWCEYYRELFGFDELPDDERFGILPKGRILKSPCNSFYLQLIEPEPGIVDVEGEESLQRIGFGTPDVPAAVAALRARGVDFVEARDLHTEARGALTAPALGGLMFELVHDDRS